MDNREFIAIAKEYAVDDVVRICVNALKATRLPKGSPVIRGPVEEDIARWMNDHSRVEQNRSEWFNRLTEEEQKLIKDMLEDCAERTLGNFLCLVDGVGGNYKGVFEIVAVEGNRRTVVNPQNTEMLHDIFSEVCEAGRQRS